MLRYFKKPKWKELQKLNYNFLNNYYTAIEKEINHTIKISKPQFEREFWHAVSIYQDLGKIVIVFRYQTFNFI